MKTTSRRIVSVLLLLILILSMIPLSVSAETHVSSVLAGNGRYIKYTNKDGSYYIADSVTGKVVASTTGIADIDSDYLHDHAFGFTTNRDGHFIGCSCGLRGPVDPHDDPATAIDGRCGCGYKYMDNADLTVMWFSGMTLSPKFYKTKTEYTAKVWNPNVTELTGTVKSFDARATIEWPEDLTIKEGSNTFVFKVTAEDTKTTKTYTITVEK